MAQRFSQERAAFCAAKRTLDGFSAPWFDHAANQRETLFHHARRTAFPSIRTLSVDCKVRCILRFFMERCHLDIGLKRTWVDQAVARCTACEANLDLHGSYPLRSHRRERRAVSEWLVDFACNPKSMRQDGEFARQRNNGSLLPARSSASCNHQSPAPKDRHLVRRDRECNVQPEPSVS